MQRDKQGTVTFYPIGEGESIESAVQEAILSHLNYNENIRQVWCSPKDRDKEFRVDDYLVTPKTGCRKGEIMVL